MNRLNRVTGRSRNFLLSMAIDNTSATVSFWNPIPEAARGWLQKVDIGRLWQLTVLLGQFRARIICRRTSA
jgi:hypothetical protein